MAYGPDIRAEAKRFIVWEGYTAAQASEAMGGNPVQQTIHNWASQPGESGNSWYDLREKKAQERFEQTQPKQTANLCIKKIHEVLSEPGFDSQRADELSKLSKHLRHFVDPRYHVSMTFQVLADFTRFARKHYPDAISSEFVQAVRDFKANERSKIEG